ncbi:unnamed protein product [Auanema sp. JU1783]|nr:unnamed protein product [Auanema sp. JU1783]
MGFFTDNASPFDDVVEKVTASDLTTEKWDVILDICDTINRDPKLAPKLALLSVKKRLNNRDPHVVILALSVLDSCWNNCIAFRKEVSSASFINELQSKATHSVRQVAEKTRLMIKKWVEAECKSDASLSLVVSLYRNLADEGYSFEPQENVKKVVVSNDPNVVHSQEEEDDIAKAIALSLQEAEKNPKGQGLYPSGNSQSNKFRSTTSKSKVAERTVRALYDFEAAEDNELSFITGDFIVVTDDSNPNWWRGRIGVQQGLFPSSFVTSDLSEIKPETSRTLVNSTSVTSIDESVLLKCIQLLEDCDPTGEIPDSPGLSQAEADALAQAPLIDARLAAVDRQSNALAQMDIAIRDVLALYDQAVQQVNPYQTTSFHPNQIPVQHAQLPPAQHQLYGYGANANMPNAQGAGYSQPGNSMPNVYISQAQPVYSTNYNQQYAGQMVNQEWNQQPANSIQHQQQQQQQF